MKEKVIKNIFLLLFSSTLVVSCSTKNNIIDFDISDLPKPKNIKPTEEENKKLIVGDDQKFIKDLEIFKSKENLLTTFKVGKKDPFSKDDNQSSLFLNFELTGFLNTEMEKYVFVKYLGNEGIISEDSIGGLNTEFLPDGAKVISINIKKMQLKINFDNEDFIFKL